MATDTRSDVQRALNEVSFDGPFWTARTLTIVVIGVVLVAAMLTGAFVYTHVRDQNLKAQCVAAGGSYVDKACLNVGGPR